MSVISIIVPIYKVEPYLRRCLDSVFAQTFTGYECILVDDASPDNCPAICDEYAAKDLRFKVIHKNQNEGLPKARKTGMDAARSELVFHLDSDDWLEPDALKVLYKTQNETGADIVMGGFRSIYASRVVKTLYPPVGGEDYALVYFFKLGLGYLWGRLYKKVLFDSYSVPVSNMLEDVMVNVQLFIKLPCHKIKMVDDILYNYDRRTNGILKQQKFTCDSLREYSVMGSLLWVKEYLIKNNCDAHEISAFNYFTLLTAIFPYLRYNKHVSKADIVFAFQFYENCSHLNLMSFHNKLIMICYKIAVFLGKLYVFLLNQISKLKRT